MNENSPASFLLLRFWLGYPQRAKEVPDLTEQSTHLTFEFGISILWVDGWIPDFARTGSSCMALGVSRQWLDMAVEDSVPTNNSQYYMQPSNQERSKQIGHCTCTILWSYLFFLSFFQCDQNRCYLL